MTTPPTASGSKGEKGDKGNRGAKGLTGNEGPTGIDGAVGAVGAVGADGVAGADADPSLSEAVKELARAAVSLAESNERMATNFIEYAGSNTRRIRIVVAALVVVIIGIGFSLAGLKVVHNTQVGNSQVIQAIDAATAPSGSAAKQNNAEREVQLNHATACINNHTDRALETIFAKPVEPVLPGC